MFFEKSSSCEVKWNIRNWVNKFFDSFVKWSWRKWFFYLIFSLLFAFLFFILIISFFFLGIFIIFLFSFSLLTLRFIFCIVLRLLLIISFFSFLLWSSSFLWFRNNCFTISVYFKHLSLYLDALCNFVNSSIDNFNKGFQWIFIERVNFRQIWQ